MWLSESSEVFFLCFCDIDKNRGKRGIRRRSGGLMFRLNETLDVWLEQLGTNVYHLLMAGEGFTYEINSNEDGETNLQEPRRGLDPSLRNLKCERAEQRISERSK